MMLVPLLVTAWIVCAALSVTLLIADWRQKFDVDAGDLTTFIVMSVLFAPFTLFVGLLAWAGRVLHRRLPVNWSAVIMEKRGR